MLESFARPSNTLSVQDRALKYVDLPALNEADRSAETEGIAMLAHDLRAPLATMFTTLEVLDDLDSTSVEDARQLLARLRRSVVWMNGMVENLSTWTAMERGTLSLRREYVPISDCIDRAVELVRPMLDRKGQSISVDCENPAIEVYVDPILITQALVNLTSNAGSYSPAGDLIEVEALKVVDTVEVRVRDHGEGIARADRLRIFNQYTRGSLGKHLKPDGQGLGLHIVKSMVELHGGRVGVESTPGHGATFWFRLPCVEQYANPGRVLPDEYWEGCLEDIVSG